MKKNESPLQAVNRLLARTRSGRGRCRRPSAQVKRDHRRATTTTTKKTKIIDGEKKVTYRRKRHEDPAALKAWARQQAADGDAVCQAWLDNKGFTVARCAA